jgi:hypothetical protein
MAGRFAEMLEQKWHYRDGRFRLRAIIRLMIESFVRHLHDDGTFQPFRLQARDALL